MNPTPEEILAALSQQVFSLMEQIATLRVVNKKQGDRIAELEAKLKSELEEK